MTQEQREVKDMKKECGACPYELAYSVEFRNLNNDLKELQERVRRLEATLGRGVLLLVANLVGVVMTLAQQLLRA